jgi:hypothetical protein
MGEAPRLQGEPAHLQFEPPWPQDVSPQLQGEPHGSRRGNLYTQSMSLGGPLELRCEPSLLHGEPTQLHAELPRPHDEHPRFRLDHLDIKTKQIC